MNDGDGNFGASLNQAVGHNIWDIDYADINGDLIMDLVVSGGSTPIYYGNGDGTFSFGGNVGVGSRAVATGDFNDDGLIDVISTSIVNTDEGIVRLHLNDGDGTFTQSYSKVYVSAAQGITSVTVGDLDSDGNLDVFFGESGGSQSYTLYGDGTGNFTEGATFGFEMGTSRSSQIVDVNGDGIMDITVDTANGLAFLTQGSEIIGGEIVEVDLRQLTQENSGFMLDVLDDALASIQTDRTRLGSQLNRLDIILNDIDNQNQNKVGALSFLQDVDYAEETAELVRLQVLERAQVAAFTQANLSLQLVLDLLDQLR
jgi:flagellin-like hook-associated protein FlgL